MSKACIFGPIHIYGKDYLPVYEHLVKLLQKRFDVVYGTYPDFWNSKESSIAFYKRSYDAVTGSTLFIAEVSSPSIGVGMELQICQEKNVPCIAICKKDVKPSKMVLGLPTLKKIIYYKDLVDLSNQLGRAIAEFI